MCEPPPVVKQLVEKAKEIVVDPVVKTVQTVGDVAYDIKKNPTVATVLPVIETAALISVGVPAPVASAAVAAANGASVEQIAVAAVAAEVGGRVGGAAGTAAASAGADAVTANIVGSAVGSATSTAVKGGSAEDILKAAAGGAAGSGVGSFAAGQGADLSTVKGIEQATGTLATTGDPTKALVAGGSGYLLSEARDSTKQPPAPVEDRSTAASTTTAEAPLTLDQQLAELITQAPPVDRTQDVRLAGPMVDGALPPEGQTGTLPEQVITGEREVSPDDLTLVGDVSTRGRRPTAPAAPGPVQGTLPPVTVTGTPEVSPDDLAIIDLITPREVGTLPEVTITPGPEEPERDFDFPDLTEEGETVTETEVAPDEKATPYKPELFITGSKSRKPLQPRSTTRLGGVTAFAPQTGLSQALTAVRPAGETEGTGTGRERQQVWNEASLRLKDALGL
jgi:hypothetical protein